MIRVVIDTNVVVSAAFKDQAPEEIILFVVGQEDFDWIVSPSILEEYNQILAREKFALPPIVLQRWRETFEQCTLTIETNIEIDFPRDQKDARFLECAVVAGADYLITGDRDFKSAQKLVETTIISVWQFKELIITKWNDK
jgi:putative PIN family toxin of toxin-antitoxin system